MVCIFGSMGEAFRAVFDPPPGAPVAVRVIGCGEPFSEGVRSPDGMGEWFLAAFHDPAPVLTAVGWRDCPAGGLVISPPGTPICHGAEDGGFRRSWLRAGGPGLGPAVAAAGLPTAAVIACDEPDLHRRWLTTLREECQHPRGADARSVADLVACWLRATARAAGPSAAPGNDLAADDKRVIDSAYLEPMDLDAIAARCATSRSSLCRAFRAAYGRSPMAYLRSLRMARAEELLLSTELPVGMVAERCAWRDIYYFSRAFAKAHGCSPSAWRARGGQGPSAASSSPS